MSRDSAILSWVKSLGLRMMTWYNESGYAHLIERIENFFSRSFHKTLAYRVFANETEHEVSGVFVAVIRAVFRFFHWLFVRPAKAIAQAAKKSACVSFITFLSENWYRVSLRAYGLFGMVFSAIKAVIDTMFFSGLAKWTILLFLVSAIAFLFSQSLADLYQGSRLMKWVGFPEIKGKTKVEISPKCWVIVAGVLGLLMGISTAVPYWYVVIAGVAGVIFILQKPRWGILLAVALFPFLPTMAVAGLVGLSMVCLFCHYLAGDRANIHLDLFDIVLLGMCVMFLYGVVFSQTPKSSLPIGLMYVLMAGSFFCFRRVMDREQSFYHLLDVMIIMASFVALYGVYQRFFGAVDTTWQDTEMFESMKTRVYSTFGNPNVLGEYLLITIPITLARFYYTKQNNHRLGLVIALTLQLGCMVFTYSRGCWIGLVVEIGIFLMFRGKKLLGIAVLGLLVLPFIVPQSIIERVTSIGNTGDSSTSYRVFIWEGTMRMLKDYGWSGVGLGTNAFNSVYPYYALSAVVAPHPHNLFLEVICESGVIGLLMFFACIICFYRALGQCRKTNKQLYTIAVALGGGMTGYLLQGMFDNVWYNYRIFFFFFIMMGMAAVLSQYAKQKAPAGNPIPLEGDHE